MLAIDWRPFGEHGTSIVIYCAKTVEVGYHTNLIFTEGALHCSIFDLINLYGALLRDVHSLGDSDWHVLSHPWWLQSIV